MTAIITVANQKGGVGKTTTAINLAAAIAHKGRRTLLIDLDPQANTTIAFFNMGEVTTSMFDVLGDAHASMAEMIKPTKDPMLHVGSGRLALAKLETVLAGQFDAPYRLKDALGPVLKDYDYVIVDTPPSLGILTVNALVASTHLLVPIQAAYFAIEGTDTHGQIRAVFGEVLFKTKIGKNVRLEESPAYKETILTFAPKSPGAVEYKKLAAEVLHRVEESRVARHAEDAA